MSKLFFTILITALLFTGCVTENQTFKVTETKPTADGLVASSTPQINFDELEATVPILIYHHIREYRDTDSTNDKTFVVSPTHLREQLQYLKDNHYNTISFQNLTDYFNGKFDLPSKPVIISFDDGLATQYQNAFNLLKEFNFQATFFIFPNPTGKSVNYMNWEQLAELRDAGMEIGSHGWYHLYLTRIDDIELERELVKSKATLEEQLGINVTTIAYPFGDIDDEVAEKIKAAGYLAARDIVNGISHKKENLFKLKGYFITNDFTRFKSIVNQIN